MSDIDAKSKQSSLAKNHKLQNLTEQIKNEENVEEGETVENAEPAEEVVTEAVSDNSNMDRERDLEIYSLLLTENKRLRADVIELESEMVGARLDNVYLDKVKYLYLSHDHEVSSE